MSADMHERLYGVARDMFMGEDTYIALVSRSAMEAMSEHDGEPVLVSCVPSPTVEGMLEIVVTRVSA